jgi:hypothetical protein
MQQFLASKNMAVAPHPHYLPYLVPCDFVLFARMELQLKGCCFQDKNYRWPFYMWFKNVSSSSGRSTGPRYINLEGEYFESDNNDQ